MLEPKVLNQSIFRLSQKLLTCFLQLCLIYIQNSKKVEENTNYLRHCNKHKGLKKKLNFTAKIRSRIFSWCLLQNVTISFSCRY